MAAHWDTRNSRPHFSTTLNGYHGRTTTFEPPSTEHHSPTTPFSRPFAENNNSPAPYYEGYTIRPDDLASSEERWSFPPKKSIPATQEDLHTEVIRQRHSGRTACRELEDCHGPKRQYIDRLIRERNAITSSGHFEVAQLRLERIPKDSGKSSNSNRNSGRNYHARDYYKQKDLTRPRQKTVYMHIILQFIKNPNKGLAGTPQQKDALPSPNVSNSHLSVRHNSPDEDMFIPMVSSDDQSAVLPKASHRPILARECAYATGRDRVMSLPSNRYISQGTQTTLPAHTRPHSDWCSDEDIDDARLGDAPAEDTCTTVINGDDGIPKNPPSIGDEVISIADTAAAHEIVSESTNEESRDIDEYEKPAWFQNLQPGLSLPHLLKRNVDLIRADEDKVGTHGTTDEQSEFCNQQDDEEPLTTHEEKDKDEACGQHEKDVLEAHEEEDDDRAQPSISSWSVERAGQNILDASAADREQDGHDQGSDYIQSEGVPIASNLLKYDAIDEDADNDPTKILVSGNPSNLPGPPPPEKLPPAERYKPRKPLQLVPARPSLTRASATYNGKPTDDSDRKSSKRVSFQQAAISLYTPPSTTTSSPVSPSASPQLPFRTIFTKPPPVNIPPGQYTPIASLSPVSPLTPPAARKAYTCLVPACDSSFDHPYDRDRHERQHEIGDPPYSECPICHHLRSGGAAIEVGLRDVLIAHINRRH